MPAGQPSIASLHRHHHDVRSSPRSRRRGGWRASLGTWAPRRHGGRANRGPGSRHRGQGLPASPRKSNKTRLLDRPAARLVRGSLQGSGEVATMTRTKQMWLGLVAIAAAALAMAGCGDGGGGSGTGGTGGNDRHHEQRRHHEHRRHHQLGRHHEHRRRRRRDHVRRVRRGSSAPRTNTATSRTTSAAARTAPACASPGRRAATTSTSLPGPATTVAGNDCDAYSQGLDVSILGGCTPPEWDVRVRRRLLRQGHVLLPEDPLRRGRVPRQRPMPGSPGGVRGRRADVRLPRLLAVQRHVRRGDGGVTLTCPGGGPPEPHDRGSARAIPAAPSRHRGPRGLPASQRWEIQEETRPSAGRPPRWDGVRYRREAR